MEILPLADKYFEEAAALFAKSFKRQRLETHLLPDALESPQNVAKRLAYPCKNGNGLVAVDQGRVVGFLTWFLVDNFRGAPRKGAYVPEWGHACIDAGKARIYNTLYRVAGERWAAAGCSVHAITLLAQDREAERAWFWNGFGLTVVDSVRPMQPLDIAYAYAPSVAMRKATLNDAQAIARLDIEHCQHYSQSPVFMPPRTVETPAGISAFLSLPKNSYWLAESKGEVVGFIRYEGYEFDSVAIVESQEAILITGAYVRPAFRGRKVAVALLDHALRDYQARGFKFCTVNFESFNPEAAAFWTKHFDPVCLSLVRVPES